MAGLDSTRPWFTIFRFVRGIAMKFVCVSAAAVMAMGFTPAALAKPVQTTKYTYYTVGGSSAAEVYDQMLRRGPTVNGAKAYAATSATTVQDGKLVQESSCRIEDYRLKLTFVVKLPKHRNDKLLPAADRRQWQNFTAFLKEHEDTHRQLWLDCAADLERKVKDIRVHSCGVAEAKANRLWDKMRASCGKRQEAFDRTERQHLMSQPFVQLVFRSATTTHAAKAR